MAANTDSSQQRIDGETPNGGTYSIAYYQDDTGQRTDKTKATKVEIVEYNDKNEAIFRTYGTIGR